MPKMIFELAKELDMGALDLVDGLKAMGLHVRNHMSSLSDEDVQKAMARFQKGTKASSASTGSKKKAASKKEAPISVSAPVQEDLARSVSVAASVATPTLRKKAKATVEPAQVITPQDTEIITESEHTSLENLQQDISDPAPAHQEESVEYVPAEVTQVQQNTSETSEELIPQNNVDVEDMPGHAQDTNSKIVTVKKRNVVLRRKIEAPTPQHATSAGPQPEGQRSSAVELPKITPHRAPSAKRIDDEIPKLRGLQVVYRPEKEQEVPKIEVAAPKEVVDKDKGKKKEFLEVRMHSFTPVYIPPKPAPGTTTTETRGSSSDSSRRSSGTGGPERRRIGGAPSSSSSNNSSSGANSVPKQPGVPLTPEEILAKEDALKLDSKKRIGGLAAMVAKPKAPKTRDIVQFRADEELKVYAQGVIGKVSYTNVGKKKIYNGTGKSTELTELKDAKRILHVHDGLEAKELANRLGLKFAELQEKALEINLLLKPTDYLGLKLLSDVAQLYRYKTINKAFQEENFIEKIALNTNPNATERAPIVAIMGHVDHGKTTLLDTIRTAKVANSEAGGITQHLGAYCVTKNDKHITFLDTPGHAAFSAMRERGAKATDIVVLVVAADDGLMPQTRESIQFCKANNVPIVVAINKMDKPGVNAEKIKQELTEYQLVSEDWGGDTQIVEVSALKATGIDTLLDAILLQAEMLELKADPSIKATGVVLESKVESGRGPVCTILVQDGTLKKGDSIIVGESYGRARSLLDHGGNQLQSVGPSMPVQVIGLDSTPNPGEQFDIVKSEREAKKIAENRIEKRKELENKPVEKITTLEDFFKLQGVVGIGTGKEQKQILKLILRTDVTGSYEALKNALATLGNADVGAEIIAGGAGPVTDGDVNLAKSSKGLILAFNVAPVTTARRLSENLGVEIRSYRIIYDLINDVKLALEGLLAPIKEEKYLGRAQIREIFNIPKIGIIAGCVVQDGKVEKGCQLRVIRDGKILHEGKIDSLKRFKDNVKEVKGGHECGISVQDFSDLKVQDIFEAYILEEKKRTLEVSPMENRI